MDQIKEMLKPAYWKAMIKPELSDPGMQTIIKYFKIEKALDRKYPVVIIEKLRPIFEKRKDKMPFLKNEGKDTYWFDEAVYNELIRQRLMKLIATALLILFFIIVALFFMVNKISNINQGITNLTNTPVSPLK